MDGIIGKMIFIFLLSVASAIARADFSSAMENYEAKKFPEAMAELKRLASLGHRDSQLNVGVMYFRGEGVDKDLVEGYSWVALAASDNNAERSRIRDALMAKMDAAQKQKALARTEYLLSQYGEAALKEKLTPVLISDADCKFKLTPIYLDIKSYPRPMREQGLEASVDVDFTVDKLGYARDYSIVYSTRKGFEAHTLEAVKFWRYQPVVAEGKPVEVVVKQVRIKYKLEQNQWNKKAVDKYVTDLRNKAENGSARDMYAFAYITNLVSELKVERRESNSWFLKAATAGMPLAQYEIGKSLIRGEGCQADVQKGIQWLTLAAQDSSPDAQYFLGVSLLGSGEFAKNKAQGINWLQHAATAKHPKASMRLAWILATDSEGSYRNPAAALSLINSIYETYPDKLRANETLAAVQAANGLFDEAVASQLKAIKFAQEIEYPQELGQQRLAAYQQRQAWRE